MLQNEKKTNNEVAKPRVRQYPAKHNGPFVVCVRSFGKPIPSLSIVKTLHSLYTSSVIITHQVNQYKLNVTFSPKDNTDISINNARNNANLFPKSNMNNESIKIYIPEKLVETIGCVSWSVEENV